MKETRTAAAYIRVSTDDQLEYSPDSQKELIIEFAKKNNMMIPEEFIFQDDGISGRSAAKRPAFQELISAAKVKPRQFDVILVWKFSRFARNQEESIFYKSMLRKQNGIEVMSVSEQLPDSEFGTLIERIIEWFDEYYSIRLSGEVRRGMKERVKQGGYVSVPPFGYKYENSRLIPDETEARYVKYIYNQFLSGTTMIQIAHELNDLGIKTKRGNVWENRTVKYILDNPVYTGKIRWSGEGRNDYHKIDGHLESTMLVDGQHAPIIDQETFLAAKEKMEHNLDIYRGTHDKILQRHGTYMLQGLVKCSSCGRTLTKTSMVYMNCVGYLHGKCTDTHSIRMTNLEEAVIRYIEYAFDNLDITFAKRERSHAQKSEEKELTELIRQENVKLQRCKEAYAAGVDTLEEYRENKQLIKARIDALKAKLTDEDDEIPDVKAFVTKHRPTLEQLKDPDIPGDQKNIQLRSFVDHIIFHRDVSALEVAFRV